MPDFWSGQVATVPPDNGQDGYVQPTNYLENYGATINDIKWFNGHLSAAYALDQITQERNDKIESLTGKKLPLVIDVAGDGWMRSYDERKQAIKQAIEQYPDQIMTDEMVVREAERRAALAHEKMKDTAESANFPGVIGGFVGGMVGSLNPEVNPLNLLSMSLGYGKTAVQTILANSGIGAASEALNQFSGVQAWHKQIQSDFSIDRALRMGAYDTDPMRQIAYTALGAGALTGVIEGGAYGVGRLLGKSDAQIGKMVAGNELNASERAAVNAAKRQITVQELGQLDDRQLHTLAEKWLQESDTPLTGDDRAALHSLDELATTKETVPFDRGQPAALAQHEKMMEDTIDAINGNRPALPDEPQLLADLAHFDGKKPDDILVNANDLVLDPKRFQFKSQTDATGANETLKSVKSWNPHAAGTITVFEGKDGKLYVADGHQRVNLAQRLIAEGKEKSILMRANVLREGETGFLPNGEQVDWSPESAMAYAASLNMIQGTGSIMDAAKILRVFPDYIAELSNNALVRDARGLSKLSDDAFSMAVNNQAINESYAALVGELVKDQKLHLPILKQLVEEGPETRFQAESMIRQMRNDAFDTTTQETLFGTEQMVESLYKPKAKVLDRALRLLREDKRLFATLSENANKIEGTGRNALDRSTNSEILNTVQIALHNIQTLAYRKGEIANALTEAAKQGKASGNYAGAARQFAETVREAVIRGDVAGDAGGMGADALAARTPEAIGETRVATGAGEIEAKLDLDTDQLARESGLDGVGKETPAASSSDALAGGAVKNSAKVSLRSAGGETQLLPSQIEPAPSGSDMRASMPSMTRYDSLGSGIKVTPYENSIRQASMDYKVNIALAHELQPELRKMLDNLAGGVDGAKVVEPRVKDITTAKGLARVQFKLAAKGGDGRRLSDYLGGRIMVDTPQALRDVMGRISDADLRVIEMENKMKTGADKDGWRDFSMQVEVKPGFTAEVQVAPRQLVEISDGPGHKLYEKWRNSPLEDANPEREADTIAMKKMYDDAWQDFLGRETDDLGKMELPAGIEVDPKTGEVMATTMTVREIAEAVLDSEALAKAARECAI